MILHKYEQFKASLLYPILTWTPSHHIFRFHAKTFLSASFVFCKQVYRFCSYKRIWAIGILNNMDMNQFHDDKLQAWYYTHCVQCSEIAFNKLHGGFICSKISALIPYSLMHACGPKCQMLYANDTPITWYDIRGNKHMKQLLVNYLSKTKGQLWPSLA